METLIGTAGESFSSCFRIFAGRGADSLLATSVTRAEFKRWLEKQGSTFELCQFSVKWRPGVSVSEHSALRARIFEASASTDPM
jgi:hypothetical protein